MTGSASRGGTHWHTILLRAVAALRADAVPIAERHGEHAADDLAQLFNAAQRLQDVMPGTDSDIDTHDLMNLLSAVRGYAEMLQEELAGEPSAAGEHLDAVLAAVAQAHSGTDTSASASGAGSAHELPVIESEPGCILAVDDRRENRELLARNLSRLGHTVITAASGEEALASLEQRDVDIVLLDLIMPGMDGHEVLRHIKQRPQWRATPVIVISGSQDMDGIIECIEAGADDYLFKPFNPVLLQARIKAGMERKRWHDREEEYRRQLERNEKFIRATFGRYLTDEIVTDILERPEGLQLGGDLRRVSIMMSDIRGFTTLSEHLAPDEVVGLLNRYLGAMTDIIMSHQGTIDEFIGDAILAVFGAPVRGNDDADRAVSCALAMQAAMRDINTRNQAEGLPLLSTGIAINTGDVIAGNIGSERRSKYGFVGHAMNVTSRIEDRAAGGEILVSDSTLHSLKGRYKVQESRRIRPRGIDETLLVHRISGAQT